ncbi:MAG: mevalonate kinase [Chloroflexi bacterium]|nr:mevalonate kinase [Chloroflexota bacterium]
MTNSVSAPAKIILFGEHAVVYGQPAIAVPVTDLRVFATFQPNDPPGQGLRVTAEDLDIQLPGDLPERVDDALSLTTKLVLQRIGATHAPDVTVAIDSQIPIASGMGSGAAFAAAFARALAASLNRTLDDDALNTLVYEIEKIHHGTPSGIDNTVIVYERPIYFVREQPIEPIDVGAPLHLLIGDTGQKASTREAVGDVRKLFDSDSSRIQPLLDEIGALVRSARDAIAAGDSQTVGALMSQNHTLLQVLTVSSPELDRLVGAATEAGALGAKLSGGGRGGNMIALVAPETQQQVGAALRAAGAVRVFPTTIR